MLQRAFKRIPIILFFFMLYGQDTLTIMNYNVLRFDGNTTSRSVAIKKVIDYVKPDLVVLEEIEHQSGIDLLLSDVFNKDSSAFAAGTLSSSQWMKNGIIYRKSKLNLFSNVVIQTVLRDIPGYTFSINNAHSNVSSFTVFGAHFKASDGSSESYQRWEEAKELYKYVTQKDNTFHYILAGDFNMYGPHEPSYKLLTDSMTVDLDDPIGSWIRNESSHVKKYTQSTRSTQLSDGGASGGLDDRFDFILFSDHFTKKDPDLKYIEGSYKVIGNDGNHFNTSILDGANSAVPDSIAEAIYKASDHYPVIAQIVYTTKTASSPVAHAGGDQTAVVGETIILDGSQSYDPNGTIIAYAWSQTAGPSVTIQNDSGEKSSFIIPELNRSTTFTFKLAVSDNDSETGIDFINVVVPIIGGYTPFNIQYTQNQGTGEDCYPSEFEGQTLEVTGIVTAVRPDQTFPNFFFQDPSKDAWSGMFVYVNNNYKPPNVGDMVKLNGDISEYFGMTEMKNISSTTILSNGNLIEPITVNAASISGVCRIWVEKYEGMLVRLINIDVTQSANQDGQWFVSDWTGTTMIDGYMYDGDWPNPEYGTHYISITGVLHYTYGTFKLMPRGPNDFNDPVTAIEDEITEQFKLLTNYPNPFNPSTIIEFDLGGTELDFTQLDVLDIKGRLVTTLLSGIPSVKKVIWDGKDEQGQTMPPGVYFARLKSGSTILNKKMILLK